MEQFPPETLSGLPDGWPDGPLAPSPLATDGAGRIITPPGYCAADLHCHSDRSDGVTSVEAILQAAKKRGLRAVAITDHDMVGGALLGRRSQHEYGIEVVVGQEVTTRWQHHIVGLFLQAAVPMFRSVNDTVRMIRDQGGLAIVAHPLLGVPSSASEGSLLRWLQRTTFDGIELDSQYTSAISRTRIARFYADHAEALGAAIGGTDAHFGDAGRVVTLFRGSTAEDLQQAIRQRQTLVARTSISYSKPGLREHFKNQTRSLLWLPLYRLRALVTRRYG